MLKVLALAVMIAQAYIGKLDPNTGAIIRYSMPGERARDPHTPIFDSNGTLRGSGEITRLWRPGVPPNMLTRFDPRPESFQSWPIRSGGSVVGVVPVTVGE